MTDIEKQKSTFTELRAVDVKDYIEKKGKFNYLSWAWAVDQLLQYDVDANWHYPEPTVYPDGTMMIYCSVKAFGRERTAQLPVLDYQNKPVSNPDAFAVNTAMQRCLVKGIALHGLGLYIYAGEDLPDVGVFPDAKAMNQWVNNTIKSIEESESLDSLNDIVELARETVSKLKEGSDKERSAAKDIYNAKVKAEELLKTKEAANEIVNDALADVMPESNYMAG